MAYTNISGKKLQSKLGGTLNESATTHTPLLLTSTQSFAKRHLEKMGWKEGTGLGKRRDGMKSHVKIKQREDEMGLGREKEKAKEMENVWWKDSVGGTLARLQQQKKKKSKKRSKEDDSDVSSDNEKKKRKKDKKKSKNKSSTIKSYTDEELFVATGGARFGMRAQRRAEGKWKRTESGAELTEMEKRARESMEWNGRGNAQVLVSGASASETKKRKHVDNEEGESMDNDKGINTVSPPISEEEKEAEEEDRRAKKKRRKMEKKQAKKLLLSKELHQVSLSTTEENENGEDSKKKKSKKEKKSKKSSKKEKK